MRIDLSLIVLLPLVGTVTLTNALIVPPPIVHAAVGFVAGSTGAFAAYPIDYVKSQLQTEAGRAKYRGGWDAALDIVRTSEVGPLALYRGVLVNIVGVAPEKTVKLSANTFMRSCITAQCGGSLPLAGEIIAGGFAGMTQVIVTNPLEVVKVKMQTSDMTVREVIQQVEGIQDLYQGAGACVARDMMFSAFLFPFYAHSKVFLLPLITALVGDQHAPAFWTDLLAGSISAGPSAIIATPADVIKTRIQQARGKDDDEEKNYLPKGAGFFQVGASIIENEGHTVLFSGWFERVVRSVPQFGVTLAVFDVLNTVAVEQGWILEQ